MRAMSCVWFASHLPRSIGVKVAEVTNCIGCGGDLWDELDMYFSGLGESVEYPMRASGAWSHASQVLGEDVASAFDLQLLAADRVACTAGTVLVNIMPTAALQHVAERLSSREQVEEFLWDEPDEAAQYIVAVAKRSPELRPVLVKNFTDHSTFGAEWILALLA